MSVSQPAIVLVHGAWADASSWNGVIPELQQRGFTVYAPPNPLRGLPQDSAYVHQFLTQNAALQGQSVVPGRALLRRGGHHQRRGRGPRGQGPGVRGRSSFPMRAIPSAAWPARSPDPAWATRPRTRCPTPAHHRRRRPLHQAGAGPRMLCHRPARQPGRGHRGHPAGRFTASAFTEPSGPPAWKTIPSWAVIGTGDQVIPPAELTFMAKRAGARITDVDAGHLSLVFEERRS